MRAAFLFLLLPTVVFAHEGSLSAATPPVVEPRLTDPTSRYSAMLEQSPFALATVVEAPPEPTESFTANWDLIGLAKLRNEKGQDVDFVSIRSRDKRLSFSLYGDQIATAGEANGISIHSIDRQSDSRKSTVMLKRGAELGKVEFSQEAAAPPAPATALNGAAMNANQARMVQAQQLQAQQLQAQQIQLQQQRMQNALTYGTNKVPGVVNPAQNMPPQNRAAVVNANGINTAVPAGAFGTINGTMPANNGASFPQPGVNPSDPNKRTRVIKTH